MSDFEFIFALFGLLLGLSLAEILMGLARTLDAWLRADARVRIGWLTPLLAAFVLLDLLSFWQAAWVSREAVRVTGLSLMAVTLFAGSYYLAAALVFPRRVDDGADLDAHFFKVRRLVIGVMLVLLVCQVAWYASVPRLAVLLQPTALILTAMLVALMIAAMMARGRRWCELAMAALVGRYAILYLV